MPIMDHRKHKGVTYGVLLGLTVSVAMLFSVLSKAQTNQVQKAMYKTGAPGYLLPDPNATPGATTSADLQTICHTKWGRDEVHLTQKVKEQVCMEYGGTRNCPGPGYEIDHLVGRELGGASEPGNLWPQPIDQAKVKDRLETELHNQVCSGKMTLDDARHAIETNWIEAYTKYVGPLPKTRVQVSGQQTQN